MICCPPLQTGARLASSRRPVRLSTRSAEDRPGRPRSRSPRRTDKSVAKAADPCLGSPLPERIVVHVHASSPESLFDQTPLWAPQFANVCSGGDEPRPASRLYARRGACGVDHRRARRSVRQVGDAESTAEQFTKLLADPTYANRIGSAGRNRVQQICGCDVVGERLRQIYVTLGVPAEQHQ